MISTAAFVARVCARRSAFVARQRKEIDNLLDKANTKKAKQNMVGQRARATLGRAAYDELLNELAHIAVAAKKNSHHSYTKTFEGKTSKYSAVSARVQRARAAARRAARVDHSR